MQMNRIKDTLKKVATHPLTKQIVIIGLTLLVDYLHAKQTGKKMKSDKLVDSVIKDVVKTYGEE